ncbi:MAG TPA: FUSC family membrane protein [Rhizomicrobium sp.]|nr:FUSC family membrane protein [Rhizomicrobium sp.]
MRLLPRQVSLAVFRIHIENGLAVAVGVGLTGLLAGGALGLDAALAAMSGAICVSVTDQPDPLRQKPWLIGFALAATCFFSALSSATQFDRTAFILATAFLGLFGGLVTVYGKRSINIATTAILAFVFAMAEQFQDGGQALDHFVLVACGAILYATYALVAATLFDDRARRLLLAEAMRAFVVYLRAKAALYNPDSEGPAAFRSLIEAHSDLADRLQAARDSLYARRGNALQKKRIDVLIALLDLFETVLSSDADMELLRHARARDLLWRFNQCIHLIADEVERQTLALRDSKARVTPRRHETEITALVEAVREARAAAPNDEELFAFTATATKLALADQHAAALGRALDKATPPSHIAGELDLSLFRQDTPHSLGVLLRQFRWRSPALRYGIRLALAMTAGFALTLVFPAIAHANWILLTIALIMRANYSVTAQRRWDRITGTLIGCALAVIFLSFLPQPALLFLIVLAVGTSHAYGGIAYRITAIGASVSSLLLLHFVDPQPLFVERIIDTLIGAGLSWVFSFLLPHWEKYDLPGIVRGLLEADAAYADAVLRRQPAYAQYRLGRKKAVDAVAALAGALRRLSDEPNVNRRTLAALGELLGANYLLASDLSSMPVLLKLRGGEMSAEADSAIGAARERVMTLLAQNGAEHAEPPSSQRNGFHDLQGDRAEDVLARRLAHIEQAAQKVARLAARPVLERI